MTTIDNLMKLAGNLEDAASDYTHDCATAIELKILNEARSAQAKAANDRAAFDALAAAVKDKKETFK